jgi:hypothetical protein
VCHGVEDDVDAERVGFLFGELAEVIDVVASRLSVAEVVLWQMMTMSRPLSSNSPCSGVSASSFLMPS